MKKYYVYKHVSPSGKVYVGQTCNIKRRWSGNGTQYLHKYNNGKYVQAIFARAILKYGWENFKHEIILDNQDKKSADYAEKYLISWYKMHNASYNMAKGGTGCNCKHKYTLEERRRISEYMKIHAPMKGKHHSPEALKKIIAANRNRVYTPEQREKMRLSGLRLSQIPITNERRAKYRKYRLAHPETWIGGWNKKEVFQYDFNGNFIKAYRSATEAAEAISRNNNVSTILNCCRGNIASAFGFIWKFTKVDKIDMSEYKVVYTSNGSRLYNISKKAVEKRSKAHSKPVNQYTLEGTFVRFYHSSTEASKFTHTTSQAISKCCNHKPRYKTAGGFKWEYAMMNDDTVEANAQKERKLDEQIRQFDERMQHESEKLAFDKQKHDDEVRLKNRQMESKKQ